MIYHISVELNHFKVVNYLNTFIFSPDVWTTEFQRSHGLGFHGKLPSKSSLYSSLKYLKTKI